jgi:hypothetical protein
LIQSARGVSDGRNEAQDLGFIETAGGRRGNDMNTMIWKCEQFVGGKMHQQNMFETEDQAREFVRKFSEVAPDVIFRIEPMPLEHVWN